MINGYRINRIFLKDFKCINKNGGHIVNLEHLEGLNILSGPNGFGKTTIFDAIELIFCDNLSRISVVNKKNKVKDNLLINESKDNAIIAIELTDEKQYLTIIKKISKLDNNKEDRINETIKSYYIRGRLDINKIDNEEYEEITNLQEFLKENLDVNNEFYNVFYYVNQENSTQFLKKNEQERQDAIDNLIQIEDYTKIRNNMADILNGNKTNSIIKKIESLKKELSNFKSDSIEYQYIQSPINYTRLFKCRTDIDWDNEEFQVISHECIDEIEKIKSFIQNIDNFKNERINRYIDMYLNNINIINNFAEIGRYINIFSKDNYLEELDKIIKDSNKFYILKSIYERIKSTTFSDTKIIDDIKYVQKLSISNVNIELIEKKLREIITIKSSFSRNQNLIYQIKEYIKNLNSVYVKSPLDQNKCPVCDTEFVNKENLQLAINAKLSTIENDNELKSLIVNKEEELKKEISAVINSCDEYFKVQGDSVVNQDELRKIEMCYKDANLANLIVFLEELGAADEVIRICNDTKDKEERIQIIRDLIINCKKYIPIGYIDLKEKYNYDNISRRYFDDESCLKEIIENQELLESKANFLKYEFEMFKLQQQRNIRDKVVELIKLEKLKNNIDTIGTIYRDEIKKFKKKLIKNIEIPLFIYTGKIIQNYQRGIGVFIKTNNDYEKIKFVPDNNTEHDIINTFSSGQLSGFVIAFMLVMNKIYNNVNRNFNTILIDDPVQTMDDINIASFVEILRNEFKDYQIILSTHEVDKANYIRYKFHKYGIDTSNYNVKEQIFSI